MKAVKFLAMMIAMLTMSVGFSSCDKGDPGEPTSEYNDYYIKCEVSGGGLDAAELNYLESLMNASLAETEWEMLKKDEAIYYFDTAMKELKSEYSGGMTGITGTLYLKFILKTTEGATVKTTTLNITKDGCTLS